MTDITVNLLRTYSGGALDANGNGYAANYVIESADWQNNASYFYAFYIGSGNAPDYFTDVASGLAHHDTAAFASILGALNANPYKPGGINFIEGVIRNADYRVKALEDFKDAMKVDKLETFAGVTDPNGDITIYTSVAFTNPRVIVTPRGASGAEGFHGTVTDVSGTAITVRVFKNKTQSVVILNTNVDPDSPVASGTVNIVVMEPR